MIFASFASAQDQNLKERVEELEPLVVESTPLNTKVEDSTQAWSVLSDDKLDKARAGTIAESLWRYSSLECQPVSLWPEC